MESRIPLGNELGHIRDIDISGMHDKESNIDITALKGTLRDKKMN